MKLHIEQYGEGPPMVFIHGWGMHRSLLRDFAQFFAMRHTICLIDLPGYGNSDYFDQGDDIHALARYLADHLAALPRFTLVGWSLGAMVSVQLANILTDRIAKLILFTATPRFLTTNDWPFGITQPALQQVRDELSQDYPRAMNRFLQLQLKNLPGARDTIRSIRELLVKQPTPQAEALQQGLQLLSHIDLRTILPSITTKIFIINGDRDSLIHTAAARLMTEMLPNAQMVIIHGAGHLPFISHATACHQYIEDFLQ